MSSTKNSNNHNKGVIGNNAIVGEINHYVGGRAATPFGGAFYAYIHTIANDNEWRFVITFASREIADEWWREVSTTKLDGIRNTIQRVTPQFYTHDHSKWNINNFFTDNKIKAISDQFKGKMFFSLMWNRGDKSTGTIIPTQIIVDHASGDWFSIRSKGNPNQYWYYDSENKCIVASESHRTPFRITAPDIEEGVIMIGRDEITICALHHGFVITLPADGTSGTTLLGVTGNEGASGKYKFEDLDKGRFVSGFNKVLPSALSYMPKGGVVGWEIAL